MQGGVLQQIPPGSVSIPDLPLARASPRQLAMPCAMFLKEQGSEAQVLPDLEPPALRCSRWLPPLRLPLRPLRPFPRLPIPRWETTRMGQGEASRPTLLSLSLSFSVQLHLLLHQGVGIRPALPCYESHYSKLPFWPQPEPTAPIQPLLESCEKYKS